jgi:hypothetical protein
LFVVYHFCGKIMKGQKQKERESNQKDREHDRKRESRKEREVEKEKGKSEIEREKEQTSEIELNFHFLNAAIQGDPASGNTRCLSCGDIILPHACSRAALMGWLGWVG